MFFGYVCYITFMGMVMSEYKLVIIKKDAGVVNVPLDITSTAMGICDYINDNHPDCFGWSVQKCDREDGFKNWYAHNEAARFNFNGCTSSSDYLIKWLKEHKKQVLALYGVEK